MKKGLFAILIFITVTVKLLAGTPVWNTGYVVLHDGRRLEGQLNYNWKAEVIQVRLSDGLVKAYSAGHADAFVYFDDSQQLVRTFSSVNLPGPAWESRPVFLEEVSTGPLTVYRRLRHAHEFIKIARASMYSNDSELIKDVDNFTYLVIDLEGQVFNLDLFDRAIWPKMGTYQTQLTNYMKSRELDASTTIARLLLIHQYNYFCLDQHDAVGSKTGE